jgi:hypothetical protein
MALLKRIYTEDNTGSYAEYWKISEINSNWITNKIEIKLVGFISEEARWGGRNPLMFKTSVATGDQALQYFSAIVMQPEGVDIIHEAYMYVKGHQQEFYDAENV